MILILFALISFQVSAQVPEVSPQAAEVVDTPAKESSDYEVDYEEEPEIDEVEEAVVAKPVAKKTKTAKDIKNPKESISQGSRAEKKIAPLLKSETKSVYKKNGKALDVDSD